MKKYGLTALLFTLTLLFAVGTIQAQQGDRR